MYEHTTTSQRKAVASVLSGPSKVQYSDMQPPSEAPVHLSLAQNRSITAMSDTTLNAIFGTASHCVINVTMAPLKRPSEDEKD